MCYSGSKLGTHLSEFSYMAANFSNKTEMPLEKNYKDYLRELYKLQAYAIRLQYELEKAVDYVPIDVYTLHDNLLYLDAFLDDVFDESYLEEDDE